MVKKWEKHRFLGLGVQNFDIFGFPRFGSGVKGSNLPKLSEEGFKWEGYLLAIMPFEHSLNQSIQRPVHDAIRVAGNFYRPIFEQNFLHRLKICIKYVNFEIFYRQKVGLENIVGRVETIGKIEFARRGWARKWGKILENREKNGNLSIVAAQGTEQKAFTLERFPLKKFKWQMAWNPSNGPNFGRSLYMLSYAALQIQTLTFL